MKESLKTQHPAVADATYEPPCMTTVPIRTSGAMLTGSAFGMSASPKYDWESAEYLDFSGSSNEESGVGAYTTFEDDWNQTFW